MALGGAVHGSRVALARDRGFFCGGGSTSLFLVHKESLGLARTQVPYVAASRVARVVGRELADTAATVFHLLLSSTSALILWADVYNPQSPSKATGARVCCAEGEAIGIEVYGGEAVPKVDAAPDVLFSIEGGQRVPGGNIHKRQIATVHASKHGRVPIAFHTCCSELVFVIGRECRCTLRVSLTAHPKIKQHDPPVRSAEHLLPLFVDGKLHWTVVSLGVGDVQSPGATNIPAINPGITRRGPCPCPMITKGQTEASPTIRIPDARLLVLVR